MARTKRDRRERIKKSIRKNISGTAEKPRLTVFRSNVHIYAQVIDDTTGRTLAQAGSTKIKEAQGVPRIQQAEIIGKELAKKALEAGIEEVVFDRNGYLYHGRVKSLADGAREGGLKF
ncbi:MAG TPA: 50S ribosomal protein L18 [Cryomorphaceae bacterium]|nr:50S ribosomal protein L18 [Cryomorphaceae bacterium]